MAQPYAALLQGGWTVTTTALLTPQVLQGVDVFVTGAMQLGTTLSPAEFTALQNWLAAGGGLLYMGDNAVLAPSNIQFGQLVNGPQFGGDYPGTYVPTVVATQHPVLQGPAGNVTTLGQLLAASFWINPTSTCTVVVDNPDGSDAAVAVTYGAGRALLLNDVAYFAYPPSYQPDNDVFWLNTIAWLGTHSTPPAVFCSGDGTAAACACGNFGAAGEGCANSLGVGAVLGGTGAASIAQDSFVLGGSGMPNSSALYFQGTTRFNGGLGTPFGDGLRCAGGAIVRLGIAINAAGASSYPGAGQLPVSVRGGCHAADTRTYQVWYRNAAPFCTSATFNLTNGLEVTWIQ
jgi:hypothetical protein